MVMGTYLDSSWVNVIGVWNGVCVMRHASLCVCVCGYMQVFLSLSVFLDKNVYIYIKNAYH